MSDTVDVTDRVCEHVRSEYPELLGTIGDCADAVASTWEGPAVSDRSAVVEPFRSGLEARDVPARLPDVLVDVVDGVGHELPARPVSAPPYVVVTSTGVLLRATLPPGRLVIAIEPFAVTRDTSPRYRRRDDVSLDVCLA